MARTKYNGGLWTKARYTSFVRSVLRGSFRRWPPKSAAIKSAFVDKRVNPKSGRLASHYLCAKCGGKFPASNIQVDHIKPIHTTDGYVQGRASSNGISSSLSGDVIDWNVYIDALFCEVKNLQVLCKPCHKIKTLKETKKRHGTKKI